ncbi:BlaI/MecI/CopY family transcriptional regulator [Allorhodopirellula heiligendammensis]|uniref:Penicillinase repressor n=1 Tax=Allorhodopirellula heiligendammensis TaxID=2714739 RepID=A0A5C6BHN1_9BACT|nr:BlaI/MecI/CopY family transcriptional regulator [Allorhodopirellula heiligendammensis]TWU11051.1 Penicillinase repressor [Allorhodopirellula heiligendammensis]
MVKTTKEPTAAELAILEQLWEHGPSSVKTLSQSLYGASTPSDIATVQKLLSRLEAKKHVERDRNEWPHLFHAVVAREELINQRLQTTADELCDGTMSSLLNHLVGSKKFTSTQRDHLRKLLDELDAQ